MELLIYRFEGPATAGIEPRPSAHLTTWRPGISSLKPKDKTWKYVAYSVFHWVRIFRNGDYCSLSVNENGDLKASMLVVPSYFRWPFMGSDDVQFTYVITADSARRQGWGSYLVRKGLQLLARDGRCIWYVTDTRNVASQKLAEKSGFELVGRAEPRRSRFQRVRLSVENGLRGEE